MSKCDNCLIKKEMELSNEDCCCTWFMDNIIVGNEKSPANCTMFIEVKTCRPIKNMAFTSDYITTKFYGEDSVYRYNKTSEGKYRVYVDDTLKNYIDLSEEAFNSCFIDE